jgi:hypothetical protein
MSPQQRLNRFLGSHARKVLRAPTKIEVLRLRSFWHEAPATQAEPRIDMYAISSANPITSHKIGEAVSKVVLDADCYDFDPNHASTCIFDPGLSFRVFSGADYVDVLVCFKCDEVCLYDSTGNRNPRYNGNVRPGRRKFLALAKRALPDDEVIRQLQ